MNASLLDEESFYRSHENRTEIVDKRCGMGRYFKGKVKHVAAVGSYVCGAATA